MQRAAVVTAELRLGIRVPDDCALVGYDGLSVTDLLDPPLTTLYLDKRRLGEMAVHGSTGSSPMIDAGSELRPFHDPAAGG